MFKDLLPIGSVIMLKGGLKKLMITGMKVSTEDKPEEFYDYIGVFYPEGYIGPQSSFLFNHDDINDVVFTGYNNPERESFISSMDEALREEQAEIAND